MENASVQQSTKHNVLARKLRNKLPAVLVLAFSFLLLILIAVRAGPAQLFNVIVTGGMWGLLAAGLALVFGVMIIPTFAHGESFMVGAYIGYFTFTPLHNYLKQNPSTTLTFLAPIIAILAAALAGAALGAFVERVIVAPLRRRTKVGWVMNAFLLTAGLSFILINGANLLLGPNFRGVAAYYDVPSLEFLGMKIAVDRVMAFAIAVLLIAGLTYFMQRTKVGRAIRAVSQDEVGAELVGINLGRIHTLTFSLATAMAATAGAALLFMFQAYPTVGLQPNYYAWYVVMLVGLGNVYGSIIGGFIVALLQTATQQFIGIAWTDVVPTVVMIIILIVVPSGIFGSEVKTILEE